MLPVNTILDFGNAQRIANLAAATAAGQPVEYSQFLAQIEGLKYKASVRAASPSNLNLSAPGATIGGVSMSNGDRFLAYAQTTQSQNGIYIFNGAASAATRSTDASTFTELVGAVVTVLEGGDAGVGFLQTTPSGTLGTDNVVFTSFGNVPAASEVIAGKAELATQGETDTGTDDLRIVTPAKLANWVNRPKRYSASIGDGAATTITVTHNLNTSDVVVFARETGGSHREVMVEKQITGVNAVDLIFDAAPSSNSIRVTVLA